MVKYNPKTCVTAKELRALGFVISEQISNDAWIEMSSIVPDFDSLGPDLSLNVTFTSKFCLDLSLN